MIRKLQTFATLGYCKYKQIEEENYPEIKKTTKLRTYVKNTKGIDDAFRYDEDKPEKKLITAQSIGSVDLAFPGAAQVFYYGPEQSLLWRALESANEGRETVNKLAKALGCDASHIRSLSDNHWNLILKVIPSLDMDVLAYHFHKLHEGRESALVKEEEITPFGNKISSLSFRGYIRDYLDIYGLKLEELFKAMNSKEKPYSKGIERYVLPRIEQAIYIKTRAGIEVGLGSYLNSDLGDLRNQHSTFLDSEEFEKEELSKWELFHRQISSQKFY